MKSFRILGSIASNSNSVLIYPPCRFIHEATRNKELKNVPPLPSLVNDRMPAKPEPEGNGKRLDPARGGSERLELRQYEQRNDHAQNDRARS